jgi:ATP-dependent Lon protease
MYRIQTKGYDVKQKTIIAKNYLIPKIKEQVKFKEEDIVICDDVIKHIIEKYTDGEQGVRNLKRCLEIIHTKLNLYRLMKPETNLFEKDMKLKIVFPVSVTNEIVDNMIKITEQTGNWHHMYN